MGEVYRAEDTRLGPRGRHQGPARRGAGRSRAAVALHDRGARRVGAALAEHRHDLRHRRSTTASVYLAMEYVEGETLSARVRARAAACSPTGSTSRSQVADALTEAHERGIVHRDIKSANVMITRAASPRCSTSASRSSCSRGRAPGLAARRHRSSRRWRAWCSARCTTCRPSRRSAARWTDAPISFSLGVVLYEMLTGRLPFEGQSFAEIVDAILNQPPPAPARFNYAADAGHRGDAAEGAREERRVPLPVGARLLHRPAQRPDRARGGSTPPARAARGDRARAPAADAQPRSIAVITFTNITREPADEWIGSGIAETVSSDLKSIHGLTVIGRERIFDALRNLQTGEAQSVDDRFCDRDRPRPRRALDRRRAATSGSAPRSASPPASSRWPPASSCAT